MAHVVTEGIAGYWHYHISDESTKTRGLCGAKTMHTSIEIKDFGVPFGAHFPKRPTWCKACAEKAGIRLSNAAAPAEGSN